MPMIENISNEQLAQLTGFDLCYIHMHPKEILGFSERLELMEAQEPNTVTGNYTPTKADDLILVDTSAGNVTITLPLASRGREFQIVKYAAAFNMIIAPTAPDTVLGSTSGLIIGNIYTSLHLKAVVGGYILV